MNWFLWRRRPAGGFSILNTAQNRRRDAGAKKTPQLGAVATQN
jgi:hypothetical protein